MSSHQASVCAGSYRRRSSRSDCRCTATRCRSLEDTPRPSNGLPRHGSEIAGIGIAVHTHARREVLPGHGRLADHRYIARFGQRMPKRTFPRPPTVRIAVGSTAERPILP